MLVHERDGFAGRAAGVCLVSLIKPVRLTAAFGNFLRHRARDLWADEDGACGRNRQWHRSAQVVALCGPHSIRFSVSVRRSGI